jgi:hypothetical protein
MGLEWSALGLWVQMAPAHVLWPIKANSKTLKLSSVFKISESLKETDIVLGSTEPASYTSSDIT